MPRGGAEGRGQDLMGGVRDPRGRVRSAEAGSGGGTRPPGGGVLVQGFSGPDQASWGGIRLRKRRSE